MKIAEPVLIEFIKDFDLESEQGIVCFEASIQYEAINRYMQLESEVHIVSVDDKDLTLVYLLHPDIIHHNIPHTIIFSPGNFIYHKKLLLEMHGKDVAGGDYVINIIPLTSHCTDPTIEAISSKLK